MALPVESIGTTHYSNVTTEIADTLDMSSMNTDLDAEGNQSDKHIISFNRNQSTFQQLLHTLGNTHQHELEEQSREWRMKLEETQQQNKATEQQLHTITTECRQLRAELDHNQEQYRMEQLRLHDSLMEAQNRIKSLEKRPSYWPFDDKVSSSLLSLDFSHEHESPSVISPVSNHERFEQILKRLSKEDAQTIRLVEYNYQNALRRAHETLEKQKRRMKRVEHERDEIRKRYKCKNEEWERWRQWFMALQKEHQSLKRTEPHSLEEQLASSHPPCPSVEEISQLSKEMNDNVNNNNNNDDDDDISFDASFENSSSLDMLMDLLDNPVINNDTMKQPMTSTLLNNEPLNTSNDVVSVSSPSISSAMVTPTRSNRIVDYMMTTPKTTSTISRKRKNLPITPSRLVVLHDEHEHHTIDTTTMNESDNNNNNNNNSGSSSNIKRARTIDLESVTDDKNIDLTSATKRKADPVILIIDGVSEVVKPALRVKNSPKRSPRRPAIPRGPQGMPTLQPKNSRMVVPHQHRVTDASTSNTAKRSTSDNIEGFVNATKLIDAAEKKQRELQNTTTPGYAYKEVVRNKEERKSMTATTCVNCDKFHKAAGPIMPFDELGSPFNKRKGHTSGHECKHNQQQQSRQIEDKDKEDEQQMANQARLQQISRHRDRHPPSRRRATSPIDYWDPEFPNTEEIEAMRAKNQTFVQSS